MPLSRSVTLGVLFVSICSLSIVAMIAIERFHEKIEAETHKVVGKAAAPIEAPAKHVLRRRYAQ